jgi:hypothetical protein
MRELNNMEVTIITDISVAYQCSFIDVERVYRWYESFDKTILIVKSACEIPVSVDVILSVLNKFGK